MTRFARLLRTYFNKPPPRLGTRAGRDLMTLARLGFDVRRLGRSEMRAFLRLIGMNIHDEVTERFESPLLRGAASLDAVLEGSDFVFVVASVTTENRGSFGAEAFARMRQNAAFILLPPSTCF